MNKKQSSRPKLPRVSEQIKAWSAAMVSEVAGWPRVSTRSFFGFTALYRSDTIFALLPRTRGMEKANSLACKLDSPAAAVRVHLDQDPRIASTHMGKARWFAFELSSDPDLRSALARFGAAYEAAGKNKKSS